MRANRETPEMLRLGLDSFSYHLHLEDLDQPRDAFWFLKKIVDLGLDGCHFDPRHLRGWNEELVRGIGRFCAEHGLYLELGSGGFDYERLADRIVLASQVGARLMRTFIGGERQKVPAERRDQLVISAVESFKRLSEVAERVEIPLALENHRDLTSDEVVHIVEAVGSPFVGSYVDTANSLPVWEDPIECVRNLAPHAAGTHLKDWKHWWEEGISNTDGCALGLGDARVAEVYPILRKASPRMPITLQIPTVGPHFAVRTHEEEDRNVTASIRFVRDLEANLRWDE